MVDALHALAWAPFEQFGFMRRALAGSLALAVSCGPLGVFLVLRRLSLMGDALSHAILPGVAAGFLFAGLSVGAMTLGGVATGLAVALLAGGVARATSLHEDASFAAFYLIALALGVLLVSLRGSSVDVLHVLFGTVLGLDDAALRLVAGVSAATLLALAAGYRLLVAECLDPGFLRSVGGPGTLAHLGLLALSVLNLVAGFQVLGTMMAVGIMMLPAASVRFWVRTLDRQLALSSLLGAASCYAGLLFSYHLNVPASPAIILCAGAVYAASLLCGPRGGLLARRFSRPAAAILQGDVK